LNNVTEKSYAKLAVVKITKFEAWKNAFINSLKKVLPVKADDMILVINSDIEKLINQEENMCSFQGRDFNE